MNLFVSDEQQTLASPIPYVRPCPHSRVLELTVMIDSRVIWLPDFRPKIRYIIYLLIIGSLLVPQLHKKVLMYKLPTRRRSKSVKAQPSKPYKRWCPLSSFLFIFTLNSAGPTIMQYSRAGLDALLFTLIISLVSAVPIPESISSSTLSPRTIPNLNGQDLTIQLHTGVRKSDILLRGRASTLPLATSIIRRVRYRLLSSCIYLPSYNSNFRLTRTYSLYPAVLATK